MLNCETCRKNLDYDLCELEIDKPEKYVCRDYLPAVRVDPSENYHGEFEA